MFNLPSDTKLLLTKNYSEISIFETLRISRVIPLKCLYFLDISRAQNPSKITKNNSQGIIFVIISCQRVFERCTYGFGCNHRRLRTAILISVFRERMCDRSRLSGSRKGGLSKGASCAKLTSLEGNGLHSAVLQGNGLPSAVVTRHPLGLEKSVQSRTGLGGCKSHLRVQTPQGRSLASASGSGQSIDLCFERNPFKQRPFRVPPGCFSILCAIEIAWFPSEGLALLSFCCRSFKGQHD